jgi:general secretion pathway protein K
MNVQVQNRSSARGIALIMVLIMIVVLGILAGSFAYSMKVETKLARNAADDAEMEWLGRSGIELARYVLARGAQGPAGQFHALNQKWAGGPGDTNDPLADIPLKGYPLGNGTVSLEIKDLDRKFNINVADEVILRQALTLIGVDAASFPSIVGSILDWRDPAKNTHMGGTPSDYYQGLTPPYYAKNGPLDDLSELLLVKGVTPAVYWGSGAGGHVGRLHRQQSAAQSHFEEPTYETGLVDLFTPTSSRLVNINTASAKVLQIFPAIDENVAQAIITARAGPDGVEGTEDDTPFRGVGELARVPGMNPGAIAQFSRYFTVRSLMFEVHVEARIGEHRREYVGLVRCASPRDVVLMNLYWK